MPLRWIQFGFSPTRTQIIEKSRTINEAKSITKQFILIRMQQKNQLVGNWMKSTQKLTAHRWRGNRQHRNKFKWNCFSERSCTRLGDLRTSASNISVDVCMQFAAFGCICMLVVVEVRVTPCCHFVKRFLYETRESSSYMFIKSNWLR